MQIEEYRPFTLSEWLRRYNLGDIVVLRLKGGDFPRHSLFVEYLENDDIIVLGNKTFTFQDLFIKFELSDERSGEWVPFGVMKK